MSNIRETTMGYEELGDPYAPQGSPAWCRWVANEIRKAIDADDQISQSLQDLTSVFKDQEAWEQLGYSSWTEFCRNYLHRPAERVDVILDGKAMTMARASAAQALGKQGRPEKHDNYKVYGNEEEDPEQLRLDDELARKDDKGYGTSADYLTARIARDHPDILERMKQGEFSSARQAAVAAGIIRQDSVRYSVPRDPEAAGNYLAERVDREWMEAMIDAYYRKIHD